MNALSFTATKIFYVPSFIWLKIDKEVEHLLFWGQLCCFSLSVIAIQPPQTGL